MKMLIGIGHKKQRGKDTVANRLVDKHGFIRVSWADSLKEAGRIIFGFNDRQLYGDLKEVHVPYWNASPRELLQKLGTNACRDQIDKEIWIKSAWIRIQQIWETNPEARIVVPDVRFENEAEFLKSNGGILIKVNRDLPVDSTSTHYSETALDDYTGWHYTIENNSTLKKLYSEVDHNIQLIQAGSERRFDEFNRRKV